MHVIEAHRKTVQNLRDHLDKLISLEQTIHHARAESWTIQRSGDMSRLKELKKAQDRVDNLQLEIDTTREAMMAIASPHLMESPAETVQEASSQEVPVGLE